jgi:hypothetical protein
LPAPRRHGPVAVKTQFAPSESPAPDARRSSRGKTLARPIDGCGQGCVVSSETRPPIEEKSMLDELFEVFERDRKKQPGAKPKGLRGLLSRLGGDDDRRYEERRYRDDDRRYESRDSRDGERRHESRDLREEDRRYRDDDRRYETRDRSEDDRRYRDDDRRYEMRDRRDGDDRREYRDRDDDDRRRYRDDDDDRSYDGRKKKKREGLFDLFED